MREIKPYLKFDLHRVQENARRFHQTAQKFWRREEYEVFFATKSNPDPRVLLALSQEDFAFEVMNVAPLRHARNLDRPVIVSGFHKSDELLDAARSQATYLVIDGIHEMPRVLASEVKNVVIRIKLGPDKKLGCDQREMETVLQLLKPRPEIKVLGLHFHAGWNERSEDQIRLFLDLLLKSLQILRQSGLNPSVVNLGGSFCEHSADPSQLERRFALYHQTFRNQEVVLHFEPGRYLVGDAGELVSQIMFVDPVTRALFLNTCAYGYRLSAGTPQARLVEPGGLEQNQWKLYGFWSAEGDQCKLELAGQPVAGDLIILENMGAYTWDMPMQFEADHGIEVVFV